MAPTPAVTAAERAGIRFSPPGRRGLRLELDPRDLVSLTGARVHPIASSA